jgi:hypothetical protein
MKTHKNSLIFAIIAMIGIVIGFSAFFQFENNSAIYDSSQTGSFIHVNYNDFSDVNEEEQISRRIEVLTSFFGESKITIHFNERLSQQFLSNWQPPEIS